MIRGLLLGILACLVGLVAIVLIRTFTFGGAVGADRIALPETPVIDTDMAAGRLSDVLQIRTITLQAGDPLPGREGPWRELEAYLEASLRELATLRTYGQTANRETAELLAALKAALSRLPATPPAAQRNW